MIIILRRECNPANRGGFDPDAGEGIGIARPWVELSRGQVIAVFHSCKIQKVTGEEFVTISKPYSSRVTVEIMETRRFSDDAVSSIRYNTMKVISNNTFLQIAGDAA